MTPCNSISGDCSGPGACSLPSTKMPVRSPSPEMRFPTACWDRYYCAHPETFSPMNTGLADGFLGACLLSSHPPWSGSAPALEFGANVRSIALHGLSESGGERCLLLTCPTLAPPHMPLSALQLHHPAACCSGLSGRCAGGPSQAPELLTHAHSRPFMFHICPPGTFWFLTPSRGDFTST